MNKSNFYSLLLICIISIFLQTVFSYKSFSQKRLFTNQQQFGVDDGLPQSYITGIIQDADGFIWLSTLDGFSRYDGRGFKNFHYNPKDSNSLASNTLNGLGKLVNNIVTIYYSPVQADEFNLRTYKVTRNIIRNKLATMPAIHWQSYRFSYNSNNWFFTLHNFKGMGWINALTQKVNYASTSNGKLHNDSICAITQSAAGNIYVINQNGVSVSDTSQTKFTWHPFNTLLKMPSSKAVIGDEFGEKFSIISLPNYRIACLEKNTLTLIDIPKKSSRQITLPVPKPNAIAGLNGLQRDLAGRLYFEYYGAIYRLMPNDSLKLLWEHNGTAARISAFFIDRSDVLWLSLNAQGLLKIDLEALHFESYSYQQNFIADMQEFWIGNKKTLPINWNNSEASYYFRQAKDSKGKLYSCNSLFNNSLVYEHTQNGFIPFAHLPANKSFSAVVAMPNNEIWAIDPNEAAWYCWTDAKAFPKKLALNAADFTAVEIADAKYVGGYIWITTYTHGLFQFKGNKLINKYSDKSGKNSIPKSLTEICIDHFNKNKFWIGTRGGGLVLWDAQKGLQRIYSTQDGLPNHTIYCILTDKYGKVWCSSNKGIFRLNPTTGHITAFEKTDGLSDNEFNRAHKLKLPNGKLVFGGLNGYSILNPSDFEIPNQTQKVPIAITGLQINYQPQNINIPQSIIKQSLSTLTQITLPYNKNYLRFEFAALLYNQPQKTKYRYQLVGADLGWIDNGHGNVVTYNALPPGSYIFKINATDKNGLWSDEVKELSILIKPPFWATWWAWLIYALVALAIIRWYFRFREKRLQEHQNLAFEKREAMRLREMDELKDRFFSNVTHEFRTPLTLIISPLQKLEQDPALSTAALQSVKTAQRNSAQLLQLINEFLDFSKLNDGQLKLINAAGELAVFTADCVKAFEQLAQEKNITLSFSAHNVLGYFLFDEAKWKKIVSNLLSNALKFTAAKGTVTVSLSLTQAEHIHLQVIDNGIGIPPEAQAKIFNRFYQVDGSAIRAYAGTGIGLSMVKELTTLMGGNLTLFSLPGTITKFSLTVPFKKIPAAHVMPATINQLNNLNLAETNTADAPLLLLVEDNEELRAFLVENMRKHYRVLAAADGLAAWDIILQELPDMVISDVMMPGQDGFDLCKNCKADHRTAHIGFILLTSKAAHQARIIGLETGADDYITKPFSLPELELRTTNLFQLQQKQRNWWQQQLNHIGPAEPLPEITDPFLIQLYREIEQKLDDAQLGVDYLCHAMAMSRSTLNRKLKALLNISTNELIKQYRLQKASSLMLKNNDIATAAYQTGFSSPSYFSQCFKEKYGFTPSEWMSKQH